MNNYKKIRKEISISSIVTLVISFLVLIYALVMSTFSINSINKYKADGIFETKSTIKYVTFINGYTEEEFLEEINETSTTGLIISDVVVPTILFILGLGCIMYAAKEVYLLLDNNKTENKLYTEENLKKIKNIREGIATGFFIFFLTINLFFLVGEIITYLVFDVIIYMFERNIKETKPQSKKRKSTK